jgi:transcriptional regulator with XRE-family HTH domain
LYSHIQKYKQLGLNIAYYRKLKGLSQVQLAELTHISRTHLSRIEAPNMEKSFSIEIIFDISDALQIDVSKLFDFSH